MKQSRTVLHNIFRGRYWKQNSFNIKSKSVTRVEITYASFQCGLGKCLPFQNRITFGVNSQYALWIYVSKFNLKFIFCLLKCVMILVWIGSAWWLMIQAKVSGSNSRLSRKLKELIFLSRFNWNYCYLISYSFKWKLV